MQHVESIIPLLESLNRDDRLSLLTKWTQAVKAVCGISPGLPEQRYGGNMESMCKSEDACMQASLDQSDQPTGMNQNTPGENIAVSLNSIQRSPASPPS